MTTTVSALLACSLVSCATLNVVAMDDNSGPDRSHGLYSDRWQDDVPRTPMWLINTFTGQRNSPVHPAGNERGIANWWRGDRAVDELINRIERGYGYGARWFFINRPMGTPGYTHVPGASWLTMEQEKRDEIPEQLTEALLDRFEEPVHVVWFIGSDMQDPRNFQGWTEGNADDFYGIGEDDTWEELIGSRVTLGGWISTGASGIAIDNSAPSRERDHYMRLAETLSGFPFNINVYGEAYPYEYTNGRAARGAGNTPLLCSEAVSRMPWIGTERYIEQVWPVGTPNDCFPVDTEETRLFVWFDRSSMNYGNESQRKAVVNRYMDMGLIPITQDPVMFTEALDRLGEGQQTHSNTSQSNGNGNGNDNGNDNSAGGGNSSRIVIRPSAPTSRRTSQGSSDTQRTSVPKQELPDRYRKGAGIR